MSTSRDMYFLELFKAFLHAHVRGRPVDCTQAWPYVAITQLDAGARLVDRMPVGVSVEVACGCSCTRVIQREREREREMRPGFTTLEGTPPPASTDATFVSVSKARW